MLTPHRPVFTAEELQDAASQSIALFRHTRMQESLEQYEEQFHMYRDTVRDFLVQTQDLAVLGHHLSGILQDTAKLTVLRYLTAPPVSTDDLEILAETRLTQRQLQHNPSSGERILQTIRLGIDPHRFPWVPQGRVPDAQEREAAVLATAALIASQRIQTARRNASKDQQENAVAEALLSLGFTEVPRRPMTNTLHFPDPGTFCRETDFGGGRADLVIRLWDGRVMPLECKVSNSYVNSVKRLNREAAAKADAWIRTFGTTTVPVAVLSGAFKVDNLLSAQEAGLTLFWSHHLHAFARFVEGSAGHS